MTPNNDQVLDTLRKCDVSPITGFLPEQDPLDKLPPEYEILNQLKTALPSLIETGKLRQELGLFKWIDLSNITEQRQLRLLYTIFTHVISGHVFMKDPPVKYIPEVIARLVCYVADELKMPRSFCHAGFSLWNWQRLDRTNESLDQDNLKLVTSFFNPLDVPSEPWFTLTHNEMEARGGRIPYAALHVQEAVHLQEPEIASHYLSIIAQAMEGVCESASRMYDGCNDYIFFTQMRRFLHGFEGVEYRGVPGMKAVRSTGNSGSMSLLIAQMDKLCGVQHEVGVDQEFREMQEYAPPLHRRYLRYLEAREQEGKNSTLTRSFVLEHQEAYPELTDNFNACNESLVKFSNVHIGFTDHYIANQTEVSSANSKRLGTAGSDYAVALRKRKDARTKAFV